MVGFNDRKITWGLMLLKIENWADLKEFSIKPKILMDINKNKHFIAAFKVFRNNICIFCK